MYKTLTFSLAFFYQKYVICDVTAAKVSIDNDKIHAKQTPKLLKRYQ